MRVLHIQRVLSSETSNLSFYIKSSQQILSYIKLELKTPESAHFAGKILKYNFIFSALAKLLQFLDVNKAGSNPCKRTQHVGPNNVACC